MKKIMKIHKGYIPNPNKLVLIMITAFRKNIDPIFAWIDPNAPTSGSNNQQIWTVEFINEETL